MLSWMRDFVFVLLRWSGVPFILRRLLQQHAVTILCYHDLSPHMAERHFNVLSKRYNFISLRQYLDWRSGKMSTTLPTYPLIVTLDDGHKGNFALTELLKSRSVPVTIALCSALVGTNRHFWWTEAPDNRDREALKHASDEDRLARLAKLGYSETRDYASRQTLSGEEIAAMRDVVDFQSHTRFHPILPTCSSQRARDEIAGSKKELNERFGLSVNAFVYPNGDYCDRDITLAQEAGYECALTLDGGSNTTGTSLFRLRRIPVEDHAGASEVIVKASGLWEMLRKALRLKRYGYWSDTHMVAQTNAARVPNG